MAKAEFTVRLTELPKFKQLLWELRMLENDMRVGASPFADRLTRTLDRYTAHTDPTDYDDQEPIA